MKKLVNSLIFTATYLLSHAAHAHGTHGSETSLMHLLTEPQHLFGFIALSTGLGLFILLRKNHSQP
jgi:hydrogenase/urease accessory protein HupE